MPVTIGGSGPITGVTSINTSVSDTELGYLDGVTSALQTQLAGKADTTGNGAWTAYTPVLTASITNPTLGTGGSVGGGYIRLGKLVIGSAFFLFGSSGVSAGSGGYILTLPLARPSASEVMLGAARFVDASDGYKMYGGGCYGSTSGASVMNVCLSAGILTSTYPVTPAAYDQVWVSFMYEAA